MNCNFESKRRPACKSPHRGYDRFHCRAVSKAEHQEYLRRRYNNADEESTKGSVQVYRQGRHVGEAENQERGAGHRSLCMVAGNWIGIDRSMIIPEYLAHAAERSRLDSTGAHFTFDQST